MQTKSGISLFPIGIGTWAVNSTINADDLGSAYRGVEPVRGNEQQAIEAIRYSLSKGQNHIDCAELYGGFYTDEVVGQALVGTPRQDLFIADKLWKISVGEGLVRPKVEQMLKKLGTDYLDLLYIHAPWPDVDWTTAIPQIDAVIDEGLVRHFGVSNFTIANMQQAAALAKHPIAANQMNHNLLYKDEVSEEFLKYCQDHSIAVVAYQPTKRGEVLANEVVQDIAGKHDATPAQVALAWLIHQGTLPIPKTLNKEHIDENVAAVDLKLSNDDIARLDKL